MLGPQPGERILDAGCGIGGVTARLASSGATVTGLELVGALLEQARLRHPHVEFIEGDLLDFTPAQPFDAVFAHAVLPWVHPPERAARRIRDCLRPGGRLAATLGGANETARQLDGYYLPKPREYRKLLERAGFAEVEVEPEGDVLFVFALRRG